MLIASEAKQVITLRTKSFSSSDTMTLLYSRTNHNVTGVGKTNDGLKLFFHNLDDNLM